MPIVYKIQQERPQFLATEPLQLKMTATKELAFNDLLNDLYNEVDYWLYNHKLHGYQKNLAFTFINSCIDRLKVIEKKLAHGSANASADKIAELKNLELEAQAIHATLESYKQVLTCMKHPNTYDEVDGYMDQMLKSLTELKQLTHLSPKEYLPPMLLGLAVMGIILAAFVIAMPLVFNLALFGLTAVVGIGAAVLVSAHMTYLLGSLLAKEGYLGSKMALQLKTDDMLIEGPQTILATSSDYPAYEARQDEETKEDSALNALFTL